jgi:putative FmdB family regulatory protein
MPVYEYELDENEPECQICGGRFAILQAASEEAAKFCPTCGLPCRRVVSQVRFNRPIHADPATAAKHGLTTYKRVGEGQWEKLDGPGVDAIVGTEEDKKLIESEKVKKIDLTSEKGI